MTRDVIEARRRSILRLGAGAALGAALNLPGAARAQAQTPRRGGTLSIALPYDLDTLNVFSTGFLGDVQSVVTEGLIAPDQDAKYFPVLATEVPTAENGGIQLSPDGKRMTITFKLRDGVKWSDGAPFTAADVRFTWMAVKDPSFIAESKEGVEDIDEIETPDPLTAVIRFNTVTPIWPSGFFSRGILPKHALEGKDLNRDSFNEKPLGTGPFMVTEFRRSRHVIVDRNPHYWRRDAAGTQLPYLDRMVFNLTPDATNMVTRLRSGEIMMAYNIPYGQAEALSASFEIIKNPILSWQRLDFNFKGPEAFRDLKVRQAFAHAINKDNIARALSGFPFVVHTPVSPQFDYYDPDVRRYAFDQAAARRLLDEAGYRAGSDGIRAKGGERMSYRITVQSGNAADETAQQVVMANLKAVGVELRPDNKAGVAFREARYKGLYDLLYSRWITSADPAYSKFYGTGGANNGTGYSNPELDDLLNKAEHSIDRTELKALFKRIQAILADDVVTIPTTSNVSLIAKTRKLQNFVPNPTNRTIFNNTSGWWLSP
ncbi:peptide ABC transporter substrate-binding protein [Roseomonas sp. BN140053]|uniref:peptide ABC transporter substrate-binding protein n=1 Tax=Roseomonas sp. BN140053 TaxID=3391898 RepID=UPI0039E8E02A